MGHTTCSVKGALAGNLPFVSELNQGDIKTNVVMFWFRDRTKASFIKRHERGMHKSHQEEHSKQWDIQKKDRRVS